MKKVNIADGEYASKWGLTDFYEDSEARLRDLIASGDEFETEWFGCKKEIRYARYKRYDDNFVIEVECHMDDLWESDDLIYDALWSGMHAEEEMPDVIIDGIRDWASDCGIEDCASGSLVLTNPTYEEVVKATEQLEDECEKANDEAFDRLTECVKEQYLLWKESSQ